MTAVTVRTWLAAAVWCLSAGAVGAHDSLYVRLGGEPGVHAVADSLIDRVVADPVTGPSFEDAKLDRIKRLLAEQICELSGGPCRYSGDSMREVHAGHHITQAQFYRMVAVLRDVLRERGVAEGAANELLRLLAPMKRDVVERAAPGHKAAAAVAP